MNEEVWCDCDDCNGQVRQTRATVRSHKRTSRQRQARVDAEVRVSANEGNGDEEKQHASENECEVESESSACEESSDDGESADEEEQQASQAQQEMDAQPPQDQDPYTMPLFPGCPITTEQYVLLMIDTARHGNVPDAFMHKLFEIHRSLALPANNTLSTFASAKLHVLKHGIPRKTLTIDGDTFTLFPLIPQLQRLVKRPDFRDALMDEMPTNPDGKLEHIADTDTYKEFKTRTGQQTECRMSAD